MTLRLPILLTLVTVVGCGVEYPCENPVVLVEYGADPQCYVDPAVKLSAQQLIEPLEGDPFLELGFYSEQLYEPLEDGDDCPIAPQSQGGVWAMPALRTIGVDSKADVRCTLTAETGEKVTTLNVRIKFYLSPEGYFEYQQLPLRIRDATGYADVEDLFDVTAEMKCSVTDKKGNSAEAAVDVVFTRG